MALPYGEEIMIVGRTMWTQSTSVADRQTDGQTVRITITNTVQRIASHGKKYIDYNFCYLPESIFASELLTDDFLVNSNSLIKKTSEMVSTEEDKAFIKI